MYKYSFIFAVTCAVFYSYSMEQEKFVKIVADLTTKTLEIIERKEKIKKLQNDGQIAVGNAQAANDIATLSQKIDTLDKEIYATIQKILENYTLEEYQKDSLNFLLKSFSTSESEDVQLLLQVQETHTII